MSAESFRREGDYWTVSYAGITCRLRDTKGLRYLACLLGQPGSPVSSWELLARASWKPRTNGGRSEGDGGDDLAAVAPTDVENERARITVTKSIKAALQHIRDNNSALADHLDATLRRGYSCVYRPDPRAPIEWDVGRAK